MLHLFFLLCEFDFGVNIFFEFFVVLICFWNWTFFSQIKKDFLSNATENEIWQIFSIFYRQPQQLRNAERAKKRRRLFFCSFLISVLSHLVATETLNRYTLPHSLLHGYFAVREFPPIIFLIHGISQYFSDFPSTWWEWKYWKWFVTRRSSKDRPNRRPKTEEINQNVLCGNRVLRFYNLFNWFYCFCIYFSS